jgi:hypothetical protein
VPAVLTLSAVRAATQGILSASVTLLAEEVARTMFTFRLKVATWVLLGMAITGRCSGSGSTGCHYPTR